MLDELFTIKTNLEKFCLPVIKSQSLSCPRYGSGRFRSSFALLEIKYKMLQNHSEFETELAVIEVLIPEPSLVSQSDPPGICGQDSFFFLYYTSVSSFINCICNDAHVILI